MRVRWAVTKSLSILKKATRGVFLVVFRPLDSGKLLIYK
jgi:hypothetical protein